METRVFKSGDEQVVADLWNRHVKGCHATGPLTPDQFCRDVAGKTYFDPEGVILAFDRGKPLAFAHAGFKSSDGIAPDRHRGTICMVAVSPQRLDAGVACVTQAVRYLLRSGARQVEAFMIDFLNTPFYNGLYGGEKAGMDEDHPAGLALMQACRFNVSMGALIMMCDLGNTRGGWQETEGLRLRVAPWTALWKGLAPNASYGIPEVVRRAAAVDKDGNEKAGISFWHLDRYNQATGDRMAVVSHVGVSAELQGTGVASALQLEVHRILRDEGTLRMGLGVHGGNGRAVSFYSRLSYRPVKAAYLFHLDWRHYGDVRT